MGKENERVRDTTVVGAKVTESLEAMDGDADNNTVLTPLKGR